MTMGTIADPHPHRQLAAIFQLGLNLAGVYEVRKRVNTEPFELFDEIGRAGSSVVAGLQGV